MTTATLTRRDLGIDLARGVAVLGMFVAHAAPSAGPGGVLQVSEYFPFPLFALLMGSGAALVARRMAVTRHAVESGVRALLLILLGLALAEAGAQVIVVLGPLGVFAALAWLVARLPTGVLVAVVLLGVALAPWSAEAGQDARLATLLGRSDVPLEVLDIVASTYYPLPMILAAAASGVLLVRVFLPVTGPPPSPRTRLLAGASCVALSGLVLLAARSGLVDADAADVTWLVVGTSLLMALGVALGCLWLYQVAPRASGPVVKVGAMAFSVYALHILWLAFWVRVVVDGASDNSWVNVVGMSGGAVALALAWHRLGLPGRWWRGPLEGAVGMLCAAAGRLADPRTAADRIPSPSRSEVP